MNPLILKRSFTVQSFRSEAVEGRDMPDLVGHAAVFDQPIDFYWFTESIARGAFAEALKRSDDTRALFNHDPNLILGRTPKTLSMEEDETGLFVRISPPNTQLGRDMVISIDRGDISQMSFAFIPEKEEYSDSEDQEKPHFTVTQVRLFDVSPVTYPAYPTTDIGVDEARAVFGREISQEQFEARRQRCLMHQAAKADPAALKQLRDREIEIFRLK